MVSVSQESPKCALLVMDLQNNILSRFQDNSELFANVNRAIKAARDVNIPVIYIKVCFREGYPEVSPNNKAFSMMKSNPQITLSDEKACEISDKVAPLKGELIVAKKRYSAFAGSDLEVILRGKQVTQLVLAGISTSGVVLSTVREAADKDYKLTVLSDCCKDLNQDVHDILIGKVFPVQADVMKSSDWEKLTLNK